MKTCRKCDKPVKDGSKKKIRCPKNKECPKQMGTTVKRGTYSDIWGPGRVG